MEFLEARAFWLGQMSVEKMQCLHRLEKSLPIGRFMQGYEIFDNFGPWNDDKSLSNDQMDELSQFVKSIAYKPTGEEENTWCGYIHAFDREVQKRGFKVSSRRGIKEEL